MALFKKLFDKLGDRFDANTSSKEVDAKTDLLKAQALSNLANQPAQTTNKWLIIIPVGILVAGGITAFILLRKKG